MKAFPIANSAEAALDVAAPLAATEREAARRTGGPVFLAIEPLEARFDSMEAAEAALGAAVSARRCELALIDGEWRALARFWRPSAAAPVARSLTAAAKRPMGHARGPEEAHAILGAPARRVSEILPGSYRARVKAAAAFQKALDDGVARILEREGRYVVELTYWRPLNDRFAHRLTPSERLEIAHRLSRPLSEGRLVSHKPLSLFEAAAPEE